MPLFEVPFKGVRNYVNAVSYGKGGSIILNPDKESPSSYKYGVGVFTSLPVFEPKTPLLWAGYGKALGSESLRLGFGVQEGHGDENSISSYFGAKGVGYLFFSPNLFLWSRTKSARLDNNKNSVYLYIPNKNQSLQLVSLVLGSPDLVEDFISKYPGRGKVLIEHKRPGVGKKKFSWDDLKTPPTLGEFTITVSATSPSLYQGFGYRVEVEALNTSDLEREDIVDAKGIKYSGEGRLSASARKSYSVLGLKSLDIASNLDDPNSITQMDVTFVDMNNRSWVMAEGVTKYHFNLGAYTTLYPLIGGLRIPLPPALIPPLQIPKAILTSLKIPAKER